MSAVGLSEAEARHRLARDGPNVLPRARSAGAWRQYLAQLTHFFAAMLWVAGGLAFLARLPELGVAIFVVVLVNGTFAYVQEHRAERAAQRLGELMPRRATVVRDGQAREIDAAGIVTGDTALLGPGDRVAADVRVEESHQLRVDTSLLTGESTLVDAGAGDTIPAGAFVVEGEGRATVVATGRATRLAGIAALTAATRRPPTPLAVELHRLVRTVAAIALAVGAAFFAVAFLIGTPAQDGFVFAIGVTVALVPEGLLPTVTLSLALGAQRMAGANALVRRLEAVETLGSTTFICTDKTGTLTQNRMAVVEVWTPEGTATVRGSGYAPAGTVDVPGDTVLERVRAAAVAATRCSTGRAVERDGEWVAQGDPMEAALHTLALRCGADPDAAEASDPVVRRFAFDPRRRRMSIVTRSAVYAKGAPDAIAQVATAAPGAEEAVARMATRGLRVLAVAHRARRGDADAAGCVTDAAAAERDLRLLALFGLEDPPRPHAAAAVAACRRAGMKVAMVTGDHPRTAAAIAREVGLSPGEPLVVEGAELPADDAVLGALVDRDGIVCARVAPEQKLRIARALRARGHVVAMTGDGVNDGPALREADIGVAMGRTGTDVAREAADLVLLDDDFATIVAAVEQGRATFANVQRFLTYHLTDNVAELTPFVVWALSGGRVPLAIGVLQVLALDIGTDTLPAVALGAEPPAAHVLDRPPVRGRLLDRDVATRAFGVLGPTEALVSMGAFLVTFLAAGWRPGDPFPAGGTLLAASGAAFAAIVAGQMANAFACRSRIRTPFRLPLRANPLVVVAVALELVALAAFLGIPALAGLLDHAPPTLAGWCAVLAAPVAVLGADALDKRARRLRPRRSGAR